MPSRRKAVRVGLRQKYTPKAGMLDTVSGAEGAGTDRRCAAGAARSHVSWFNGGNAKTLACNFPKSFASLRR